MDKTLRLSLENRPLDGKRAARALLLSCRIAPNHEPNMQSPESNSPVSVSQLNQQIRDTIQSEFSVIWVVGEITDLSRPRSGHIYFGLKDEDSQIRAVAWKSMASRLKFDLEDGMQVLCKGYVDVYPPRGTYQVIAQKLEPVGIGGMQQKLDRLREKLSAEGLFRPEFKKPLPNIPNRIAVVTSPTGAAIQDFLQVIKRRWPTLQVDVIPTRVQGEEATSEIVKAIKLADTLHADVLIVTRGGGSLEDLWCFNEEEVVRAIFQCETPVVSAIGHEIDVTLCDMVADLRALTPTEAAERIVPDHAEVRNRLTRLHQRLIQSLRNRNAMILARLESLEKRISSRRVFERIRDRSRTVDELQLRLSKAIAARETLAQNHLSNLAGKLESLSPVQVLARGYSVTQRKNDGAVVRVAEQVNQDDVLVTTISGAQIESHVKKIKRTDSLTFRPDSIKNG